MAKNKTIENDNSVASYLNAIEEEDKRKDTAAIVSLIQKETGLEPKMWGTGMVGFGSYQYKYESGREGDAPLAGLSARANAITLYIGTFEQKETLLKQLGKYKEGKGCLYIKRMADIDTEVLAKIVSLAVRHRQQQHSSEA